MAASNHMWLFKFKFSQISNWVEIQLFSHTAIFQVVNKHRWLVATILNCRNISIIAKRSLQETVVINDVRLGSPDTASFHYKPTKYLWGLQSTVKNICSPDEHEGTTQKMEWIWFITIHILSSESLSFQNSPAPIPTTTLYTHDVFYLEENPSTTLFSWYCGERISLLKSHVGWR